MERNNQMLQFILYLAVALTISLTFDIARYYQDNLFLSLTFKVLGFFIIAVLFNGYYKYYFLLKKYNQNG